LPSAILISTFLATLQAAPRLRLDNTSIYLKQSFGESSPSQTIYARNLGDGALNLSISIAPVTTWLTASIAPPESGRIPIRFQLHTASLPAGTHTAEIIVNDPLAADAPQTIMLTIQVGETSSGPYVQLNPGSTSTVTIPAPNWDTLDPTCTPLNTVQPEVQTSDGGNWLLVSLGFETFGTYEPPVLQSVTIQFAPPPTMPPGVYTGQITLCVYDESIVADSPSVTVPVTMAVISGAIANPSTSEISMTLPQGVAPLTYPFVPYIALSNSGNAPLQVQSVAASGPGISAYDYGGLAIVTLSPGALAAGNYTGTVTIQCSGGNCPIQIPVSLTIEAQGPPVIENAQANTVSSAAAAPPYAAPGEVAIITGDQLSLQPAAVASYPLPIYSGGASVYVNGVSAPLYYSSYDQIAFQIPYSTPAGRAHIQMVRDGQASNIVGLSIQPIAPEIIVITDTSYNMIDSTHPAAPGQPIVIWSIGLGATNPPVVEGIPAPSNPLATAVACPAVQFVTTSNTLTGAQCSPAVLTPGEAGLYQITATVPSISGNVNVALTISSFQSNAIPITVQ
jgi:uncharacterized protein (TIGR03437 family)